MKRVIFWVLMLFMLLSLGACGQKAPTWQEQYDLGVRYLSEGNYEEAIIAFTAAIEIDPKQALAYVGRGDAYIGSGESDENLAAAQADYVQAIELDETNAEAYLGLADVYIRKGDYEKAIERLQEGIDRTSDSRLQELLHDISLSEDVFVNGIFGSFINFDDLETEAQDLIKKLADSCISNSVDTTMDLLTTEYVEFIKQETMTEQLRTIWNGNKIQISYLQNNNVVIGGVFQMRPISGTAYYCHAHIDDGSGQMYYSYCIGSCENWNWNGPFELTATVAGGYEYYESGDCINGLRNGSVYETLSQEYIDAFSTATNNYYTYYDMGKEIKTVFSDGSEHPAQNYSEDDVFVVIGRTHVNNYEYMWLW